MHLPMEMIRAADRLGYFAVWTAEAYGSDAVTPLAWIGAQTQHIHLGTAIMQIPARTPAMTAMTAITLDQLSGGRMLLGLGLSGPQVVEGWHGQPYGKPLPKTREYVEIVRAIFAREKPLAHSGHYYQIPYTGPDATGLGKPLKSIVHGRADLPIYLAAIGPKNVELAAEIADGWLPMFFAPSHYDAVFKPVVEAGFAKTKGKDYGRFDIAPTVFVVLGDDVDACRAAVKPFLALYVGGMGAKGKNFYYDLVCRYGFEEAAEQVQTLYLGGRKEEAAAAIPDALVDEVALCGPETRIAAGLERWQAGSITTLTLNTFDPHAVELMARLVLGADAGQPERTISLPNKETGESQTERESSAPQAAEVFEQLAARIAANPQIAAKTGAVFQFNLSDGEGLGSAWVLDLKQPPGAVREGTDAAADCILTMSEGDFVAMSSGALNPMAALGQRRLKLEGNMMLAMKLQSLFG